MVRYRRRSRFLRIFFRFFRWLLVPVTDVLSRPGATRGFLGGFLIAIFYIQLLVTTDGRIGEGHELIEHRELKLQLDTVDHRLQCGFDRVEVGVLHCKEANIHPDDD